jgi:hypothetical protein
MFGTLSDTSVYSEDDSSAVADSADASPVDAASEDSAGELSATGVVGPVACWHPTQTVVKAEMTATDKILFTFFSLQQRVELPSLVKHRIANTCHDYCYRPLVGGFFQAGLIRRVAPDA